MPLLAATDSPTVPLPLPFCPDTIEIQLAPLEAVHAQPAITETSTDSRPPLAPIESPARLSEKRQGAAA